MSTTFKIYSFVIIVLICYLLFVIYSSCFECLKITEKVFYIFKETDRILEHSMQRLH